MGMDLSPAFDKINVSIQEDLREEYPFIGTGKIHDHPVLGMAAVESHIDVGQPVVEGFVDVVQVVHVRGGHRDERRREGRPGSCRGDDILLERLEQDVLGPLGELSHLVHDEQPAVRLEQFPGFKHQRGGGVADLLELVDVQGPGEVVGEHLGGALDPCEPVTLPHAHEDHGDLPGVHLRVIEPVTVLAGSLTEPHRA